MHAALSLLQKKIRFGSYKFIWYSKLLGRKHQRGKAFELNKTYASIDERKQIGRR